MHGNTHPSQPKPTVKPTAKPPRPVKHSDFSEEFVNHVVSITLINGTVIKGLLVESRKFWIKVIVDGRPRYVNKAHVIEVAPAG
jgi:sRNA-binding regulator protein Hfq